MDESRQSGGVGIEMLDGREGARRLSRPDVQKRVIQQAKGEVLGEACGAAERPARGKTVQTTKRRLTSPSFMVAYFAMLNVVMYLTIHKFWIGGSSFLPMVGKMGEGNKFLLAFFVNIGVIVGAFVGAYASGEFRLRFPRKRDLAKSMIGGMLIGMGVTVAPGTCTTAFVTGMPMLSVSSLLSIAGILIGTHIVYRFTLGRR